jgi:hypothetical protein
MKTRIFPYFFILLLLQGTAFACEVCEAQQPKILRGITHGAGPQGNSDYVIVIAAAILVLFTLVYAIKFLAKPGERGSNHIKRTILQENRHGI